MEKNGNKAINLHLVNVDDRNFGTAHSTGFGTRSSTDSFRARNHSNLQALLRTASVDVQARISKVAQSDLTSKIFTDTYRLKTCLQIRGSILMITGFFSQVAFCTTLQAVPGFVI